MQADGVTYIYKQPNFSMLTANQNPEQLARDQIDQLLAASGWLIQSYKQKNIAAGLGCAIRENINDTGPADYILSVNN